MIGRAGLLILCGFLGAAPAVAEGIGSRVFVVERESGSLAVYDFLARKLLPWLA